MVGDAAATVSGDVGGQGAAANRQRAVVFDGAAFIVGDVGGSRYTCATSFDKTKMGVLRDHEFFGQDAICTR